MNLKSWFRRQASRRLLVLLLFLLALLPSGLGASLHSQPAQETKPVRFVVIGDGGTGDKYQERVADQMLAYHDRYKYEFVIMAGDNIYPNGNPNDYRKKFEAPYAALLARGVKFYATLGNHDAHFGNWEPATKYPGFNMGDRRYYTFTKGDGLVQFFVLDSTTLSGGRRDQDQLRWLQQELRACSVPWKMACFHHPIYSSGKTHGSDVRMRAILEPLLIEGGVRVAFSGHDHIYERVVPQHGIQYFVTGSAGQLRRGNIDSSTGLTAKGNDQVRHFIYVEIDKNELKFQAISEDGEVIDSGTVLAPTQIP
ncbi:MAG: metallophosphoesterase [Acidobacteria bacterium]|nr:metallophosphoesterase [Acidobacteriota bacterium]